MQIVPHHGLSRDEVDRIERESFAHARSDMARHRIADLLANSRLDLLWIRKQLERAGLLISDDARAGIEKSVAALQGFVDQAAAGGCTSMSIRTRSTRPRRRWIGRACRCTKRRSGSRSQSNELVLISGEGSTARLCWPVPSKLNIAAHAKINLALAVGPPAPPHGYHPICSWMSAVDVFDDVEIERLEDRVISHYAVEWCARRGAADADRLADREGPGCTGSQVR
ncbi:MAG: hypothetical protein QM783_01680 [Phycisphaerales bacterium]